MKAFTFILHFEFQVSHFR